MYSLEQKNYRTRGCVYGVSYTNDFLSTQYICCKTKSEIGKISGVKYTQSSYPNVHEIQESLKKGILVLFIGLPCVVTELKNHFKDFDNFFTIALFCQGVSSPLIQAKLVNM